MLTHRAAPPRAIASISLAKVNLFRCDTTLRRNIFWRSFPQSLKQTRRARHMRVVTGRWFPRSRPRHDCALAPEFL